MLVRLSVKGVRGHLVRFLLTALAVTLGVAFVAGSFMLRDSIQATLDDLLNSASKGVDVVVRGAEVADGPRRGVPISAVTPLARLDGVARATPDFQGNAMVVGKDGVVVRNGGAPTFGFAFRDGDPAFTLVSGRGPRGPGEIVVEQATLARSGLKVGDATTAVVGPDARQVLITGEVVFGSLFGATAILVDEATARAAFAPDGNVYSVSVQAAPGVTAEQLLPRVKAVIPAGTEALTGQAAADEQRDAIATGLGFFTTFLLVFAGITLFVGAFIIVNTFAILLAQRTRELALLRAIGASRGQVQRMVLGEAVIIGIVGSGLGIAAGAGLVAGLKLVLKNLAGIDVAASAPLAARTVLISIAVGVLVTVVSAVLPARRASRIPPVAAMRDDAVAPPRSIRRRGTVGVVLFVTGAAALTWGVTRPDAAWTPAGVGAALVLLGALVAAPLAARPVVHVLVWPFLAFGGVVGRLAGRNALRVPRRTANTASALMIGLTLVSALAVVASSIKVSVAGLVEQQLTADFVLTAGGSATVPAGVAAKAAGLPGVRTASSLSYVEFSAAGDDTTAAALTRAGLSDTVRLDLVSGDVAGVDDGRILVNRTTAAEHGWTTGSTITATVGTLTDRQLTVGGVYQDNELIGTPFIIGRDLYTHSLPASQQADVMVAVRAAPGTDLPALRTALTGLVKPYLVVSVESGSEYVDSASSQIDQLLQMLYVLLALAIVIAVLGIVNTLALSVVERTREIGLLRAVGLARGQLSRMIVIESVATAVFGAVLGTLIGIGLGTAFQHGMRTEGLTDLAIPWGTVATVLGASVVVGIVAAALPAIRAVRLNVLQAIATD